MVTGVSSGQPARRGGPQPPPAAGLFQGSAPVLSRNDLARPGSSLAARLRS
jgi:hypothetical protein